jgi:S1-C subfamily serine protease
LAAVWLQVRTGADAGTAVELPSDATPFVLGRQPGCDLVVRDERASRRHLELTTIGDGRVRLSDLGSANGTVVDGRAVQEAVLEGGEDLRIGDVVIAVLLVAPGHGAGVAGSPEDELAAPTRVGGGAFATPSMVRRMVEQGTRRARRTALAAGALALVAVVAVVVLLGAGVIGGGDDGDVPAVVSQLTPSTVLVITERDGARTGNGSGWVLDAGAGLIATNAHVVNQGTAMRVVGDSRSRQATVAAVSPCEDLALLRVADARGLRTAPLASDASVRQGETVVALGHGADAAAGDGIGSTTGVVSVAHTSFRDPAPDVPKYPEVVQTDTPLNPGNSGGPLADLDGRVIGVDSAARATGSDGRPLQNVNYAIAIGRARRVLAELESGRAEGWTGFTFAYPTDAQLREARLPPGLRITGAIPGTTAARSGVPAGSLLAGVDGKAISNTLSSYCSAVRGKRTGDEVVLAFARPGSSRTRQVRLRLA